LLLNFFSIMVFSGYKSLLRRAGVLGVMCLQEPLSIVLFYLVVFTSYISMVFFMGHGLSIFHGQSWRELYFISSRIYYSYLYCMGLGKSAQFGVRLFVFVFSLVFISPYG